jgi:hypothetical protein
LVAEPREAGESVQRHAEELKDLVQQRAEVLRRWRAQHVVRLRRRCRRTQCRGAGAALAVLSSEPFRDQVGGLVDDAPELQLQSLRRPEGNQPQGNQPRCSATPGQAARRGALTRG